MVDLIWTGAIGLAVYKIVQLEPYEATILLDRCVHVFIAAMQGCTQCRAAGSQAQ